MVNGGGDAPPPHLPHSPHLPTSSQYERKFERVDKEKAKRRHLLSMRSQWDMRDEHRRRLASRKADFDMLKAERVRLRDGFDEDDDTNYVITETYLEEVLEEKETIMHSL